MSLPEESVASFKEATRGQHRAAQPPSMMEEIVRGPSVQGVAVLGVGSVGTVAYKKRKEVRNMVSKVPAAAKVVKEFAGENPVSLGAASAVVVGIGCAGYALYSWWTGSEGEGDQGKEPDQTRLICHGTDEAGVTTGNQTV
jgi:hypothetical protein